MQRPKIIVFSSRTDAYLKVLVSELREPEIVVISNCNDSPALRTGQFFGLEHHYFSYPPNRSELERVKVDTELGCVVSGLKPDLIVFAGWLRVLGRAFIDQFPSRTIINVHAAILPKDVDADSVELPDGSTSPVFRGLYTIERAVSYGVSFIGSTVHWVTENVDKGEVLQQKVIPLPANSPIEDIRRNLFDIESCLLVSAICDELRRKGFKGDKLALSEVATGEN